MNSKVEPWVRTEADREAVRRGYVFDEAKGEKVCRFIETQLKCSQGEWAGKPFRLEPWERDFIMRLFGWMRPGGLLRRFRRAYVEIAKKNGKTSLFAALSNYMMLEERGAVICQAARDIQQGLIVHEEQRRQIKYAPALKGRFKVNESNNTIKYPERDSITHLLSSKAKSAEGKNATFSLIDELHEFNDRAMYDKLRHAGAGRTQPIFAIITTAGNDPNSVCYQVHQEALEIIEQGSTHDLEFLAIVYAASPDDDLDDPATWRKANPSLGTLIGEASFRNDLEQAKRVPTEWAYFKRVRLNIWGFGDSDWFDISMWDARLDPDPERRKLEWFRGREAYVGVDLSQTVDLTAITLVAKDGRDLRAHTLYYKPTPSIVAAERRDKVPYRQWVADGHIIGMPTPDTDFETIESEILRLRDEMGIKIQAVGFDRYNAAQITQNMKKKGIKALPIAQTIGNLSGATKELERRIHNGTIFHNGNPVDRYCFTCVRLERDNLNNIKPGYTKPRRGHIDGVISLVQAILLATQSPSAPNPGFMVVHGGKRI